MKPKTLLLLVIIGGILVWLGLKEDGPQRQVKGFKDPQPFKNLDFNSIDDVLIVKGADRLHLQLKDESWKAVAKEVTFEAEFNNLRKLLLEVRDIEWLRQPAFNDKHDAKFGLDDDSQPGRLELKSKGKVLLGLTLGKGVQSNQSSPFGFQPEQGQHIRVDGTPGVFYAKERLGISLSPGEWIDKVLAKAEDTDEISMIEITSLGHKLTYTKDVIEKKDADGNVTQKDDLWKVHGDIPKGIKLLPTRVTKWVSDLKEVQVQEPVDITIRKDFPAKADHILSVKSDKGDIYTIEAQNLEEDWYLWLQGDTTRLFKASKYVVEDLFHKKTNLFDMEAETISLSGNISSAFWSHLATSVSLDGETWSILGDGDQPELNEETFNNFKNGLNKTKVSNFFPGLERKSLKTLTIKTEKEELILEDCGASPFSNTHLVKKNGVIYTIPKESFERLFPKSENLLAEYSPVETLHDISSISLTRCKLTNEGDGKWKADEFDARTSSVSQWLTTLKLLFKSPYDPNKGPITTSATKLKFKTKDDKTYTIEIGQTEKGKTPIKFSAFAGTFTVNFDLAKSLNNGKGYFVDNTSDKPAGPEAPPTSSK